MTEPAGRFASSSYFYRFKELPGRLDSAASSWGTVTD